MTIEAPTYCVFDKWPDGTCHCVRGQCGRVYPSKGRSVGPNPIDCSKIVAVCKGSKPTKVQQAINLGKATVEHVATGMKIVSQEVAARRTSICPGCNLYQRDDKGGGFCSHIECGCGVTAADNFALKVTWKEQKCPHPKGNKWEMTDEELNAIGHPEVAIGT